MKCALSTRFKTTKAKSEILDIALREITKHAGSGEIAGDTIVGKMKCADLVTNHYTLTVTQRDAGFSIDVQVERLPSMTYWIFFIVCLCMSCLLLPLIALVFLMVKVGNQVRDQDAPPLKQVLDDIKAECEF